MVTRAGMLITPEEYVAENLWGRTREAAVKKVEELREMIKQLRSAVEEEKRSEEWKWRPFPSTAGSSPAFT